jgi:hypothetical protein
VIYRNRAALRMHGFTSDQGGLGPLQEMSRIFQLWTLDGRLLTLDEWPMRQIKRGETVNHLELRLRRPDQGWEKMFHDLSSHFLCRFMSPFVTRLSRATKAFNAQKTIELQCVCSVSKGCFRIRLSARRNGGIKRAHCNVQLAL